MTSAMPITVTVLCVALFVATGLALWFGFAEMRINADVEPARHRLPWWVRLLRPRLRRRDRRHVEQHDLVAALGSTNQRGEDAPTGSLEPAQIARLLETR